MLAAGATNLLGGTIGGLEGGDGGGGKHIQDAPPGQKSGIELPGFDLPPKLRDQLSATVLEALAQYKQASEDYLKRRREITERLHGATSDQRKELLDLLRSSRERFLADTRDLRTEISNQISANRDKLKPKGGGRPGGRP